MKALPVSIIKSCFHMFIIVYNVITVQRDYIEADEKPQKHTEKN